MENKNEITYKKETFYKEQSSEMTAKAFDFAKDYAAYLDSSKTEREAVSSAIELAKAEGFVEYKMGDKIERGNR